MKSPTGEIVWVDGDQHTHAESLGYIDTDQPVPTDSRLQRHDYAPIYMSIGIAVTGVVAALLVRAAQKRRGG